MTTTSEGHQVKKQNSINYNPAFQLDGSRRTTRWIEYASDGLRLVARPGRGFRATVRGAVKSIRRLTAEPWTAVSNY